MKSRIRSLPQEKEVVVIGNGPSAMFTSFLLSGNQPYYTPLKNYNDTMYTNLFNKLESFKQQSLFYNDNQDIKHILNDDMQFNQFLDALLHPMSDMDPDHPSFLSWKKDLKCIPHIVLGNNDIGGIWSKLSYSNMRALSPASFLQLPGLTFDQWNQVYNSCLKDNSFRPKRSQVAQYFKDYIQHVGIQDYFYNDIEVTQVISVQESLKYDSCACRNDYDSLSHSLPNKFNFRHCLKCSRFKYLIKGIIRKNSAIRKFSIRCNHVIMATGAYNQPKTIKNINLDDNTTFYKLSKLIQHLNNTNNNKLPVLVIGSGLSAADTILSLKSMNVPIIHMYYSDQYYKNKNIKHPLANCWKSEYPEYYEVYQSMKNNIESQNYLPFSDAKLIGVNQSNQGLICTIQDKHNNIIQGQIKCSIVLIGSIKSLPYLIKDNSMGHNILDYLQIKANDLDYNDDLNLYAVGSILNSSHIRHLLAPCLIADFKIRMGL